MGLHQVSRAVGFLNNDCGLVMSTELNTPTESMLHLQLRPGSMSQRLLYAARLSKSSAGHLNLDTPIPYILNCRFMEAWGWRLLL